MTTSHPGPAPRNQQDELARCPRCQRLACGFCYEFHCDCPMMADLTDLQGHLIDPPLTAPPNPVPPRRSARKPVRGRLAAP